MINIRFDIKKGFHIIINMKMNQPMGSIQNVEIYYESDIPFPASSMMREQILDTEAAFLRGSK